MKSTIVRLVVVLLIIGTCTAAADSWTTKTAMPTQRWGLTIGAIASTSKLYAIGGRNTATLATNEEYTPDGIGIADNSYVKELTNSLGVIASPSIFDDRICLRFSVSSNQHLLITLYNASGRYILEKSISCTPTLITLNDAAIKGLAAGVYFLEVNSGAGKSARVKLIKQ